MRPDFKKVLCERPRRNGAFTYHDLRAKQGRGDLDDLPACQGISRPYQAGHWSFGKEFSDLIGPLHRFFQSRVGQRYDDVWSELCEHLGAGTTIDQHLKLHARQEVETETFLVDGEVRVRRFYGPPRKPDGLYVDPRDGRIHRAPDEPRRGPGPVWLDGVAYDIEEDGVLYPRPGWRPVRSGKKPPAFPRKIFGPEKEAVQVDGLWYWVVFATVHEPTVQRRLVKGELRETVVRYHGTDFVTGQTVSAGRYRAAKRQMASRDLRRNRLVNAVT
jgi:hypothetical protein